MKNKKQTPSLFDWLKFQNWSIVKVYRDFENYFDWKRVIKREEANPKSKYNKWKLSRTSLYDIYTVVSLDESDIPLPEEIKRTKVIESLNPLHRYLDEDLGFAECLNCEFNQYEDDEGKPTLSYLIVYRLRFEKFSILWSVKFLLIVSLLTFVTIKFHLFQLLLSFLTLA